MSQVLAHYYLRNAGSLNMAVDGSSTPVVFSLDYASFKTLNIFSIEMYLEATGNVKSYDSFWTLPGLATGIEVTASTQQETFNSRVLQTTRDIFEVFDPPLDIKTKSIDPTKESLRASFSVISGGLVLSENNNNDFTVTINDDLTALDKLSFAVKGIILP